MNAERKLTEEARKRYPIPGPNQPEAEFVHSLAHALEAALARESHLRGIIGGLNPGLDIDAALAAGSGETQEAADPDDYTRPGWRMFPVL